MSQNLSSAAVVIGALRVRCFYWPIQCSIYLLFLFRICRVSCLVVTCWKKADLLALLCVMFLLRLCYFPMWCLESGVVLDCVDS